MIDLFIPPVVRPARITVIHRISKPKSRKADYYRKWYAQNREKRLQEKREDYQRKKDEYKARARKWTAQNRERRREIQRRYERRKALKASLQVEIRVPESGRERGDRCDCGSDS